MINLSKRNKYLFVGVVAALVLSQLLWDHFHGGVPSHYLLHDKNMPKFSNWWSLVTVPIVSWVALWLLRKKYLNIETGKCLLPTKVIYGFIAAFLFGILITVLFYTAEDFTSYPMLATFVVALFIPLYRAHFILGLILGMVYGFGGVIPVIAGLILAIIYFVEYEVLRRLFLKVVSLFR